MGTHILTLFGEVDSAGAAQRCGQEEICTQA